MKGLIILLLCPCLAWCQTANKVKGFCDTLYLPATFSMDSIQHYLRAAEITQPLNYVAILGDKSEAAGYNQRTVNVTIWNTGKALVFFDVAFYIELFDIAGKSLGRTRYVMPKQVLPCTSEIMKCAFAAPTNYQTYKVYFDGVPRCK